MKRSWWLLVGVLVAAGFAGALLARGSVEAAGSTLSRGPGGWLAARVYLEARGTPVRLLDGPLAEAPRGSLLVLAFPWQNRRTDADVEVVEAHLHHGGAVLLAYGGELAPGPGEAALLGALGAPVEAQREPPVAPWRWQSAQRTWTLRPTMRWRGASEELRLRRPRWLPRPPIDGTLLKGPNGQPVMAAWDHAGGRVVMLPAELLCNARLRRPAHAALLETLRGALPAVWAFDELHHGLARPEHAVPAAGSRGLDLLLAQVALVYAVAALALARRFGPAWRETPPLRGSAAAFLLRLGRLHHRLGHHRQGAELLLARAAELDRRFAPDAALARLAERGDPEALVAIAQRLAQQERERRR